MEESISRAQSAYDRLCKARIMLWAEFEALVRSETIRRDPARVELLQQCLTEYRIAAWGAQAAITAFILACVEEGKEASA